MSLWTIWTMIGWIVLAAQLCIAVPVLYLCTLAVSALLATRRSTLYRSAHRASARDGDEACTRFAILVPAHNEESMLTTLLLSLKHLAYPTEQYAVHVVADNCTDGTASLARAAGVHVHERTDAERRGKGYAISWLLQQLEAQRRIYDAYVVLDADSVVEPIFLSAMARELMRGGRALQANNTVLNVTEAPSATLRWLALTLMNHVRPLGRNGLGVSATLTGNGMCLSCDLLVRYPWQSFALSEDYLYYLRLVQGGERIRYVPDAVVRSQMPTSFRQMRTQDVRWEAVGPGQGDMRLALNLLGSALRGRDLLRLDALVEFLTPPLSFLVMWSLLTLVSAAALRSLPVMVLSLILVGGLAGYIGTGLYLMHAPRAVIRALFYAPGFIAWKLWVYFVLRHSRRHTSEWVRTSRDVSAK
jgi:glycosyltransferase involved in cell wall biosynthesis